MLKLIDDYVLESLMDPGNQESLGVIPVGLKKLGINIGDSFRISNGSISVTRIDDKDQTQRKLKKYPAEELSGWPYPADSEMKSCPFRKTGSVAIVAPNRSKRTLETLIQCYEKGADAVGFCHTPHMGVERVIGNLVGNPNYRFLFVFGSEGIFGAGRALIGAYRNGIDWQSGLVIGADTSVSEPVLLRIQRLGEELGGKILRRFQDQVTLIDMMGEEVSATCLSFLTRLCKEERSRFEVEIKGARHLLTARGAYEENGLPAAPISFRPKELAFIDRESAGSFQTSSLLVETIGKAYDLVIGTALEHGRLTTLSDGAEGLQIRNLCVLCEDPRNDSIAERAVPEGTITRAEDKKEFLEKYAFWTYLVPFTAVLWKQGERRAVPRIAQDNTYGTRLCAGGFDQLETGRKAEMVEYVSRFQMRAGNSLPSLGDVLDLYRGLSELANGKTNGREKAVVRNQLQEMIDEIKSDIGHRTIKECYTLVIEADLRYETYIAPRGGELTLETTFSNTRDNALNWFPRAYGGIKLGSFLSEACGVPFQAYVHQSRFFEMRRGNINEELYDRKRKEAFGDQKHAPGSSAG